VTVSCKEQFFCAKKAGAGELVNPQKRGESSRGRPALGKRLRGRTVGRKLRLSVRGDEIQAKKEVSVEGCEPTQNCEEKKRGEKGEQAWHQRGCHEGTQDLVRPQTAIRKKVGSENKKGKGGLENSRVESRLVLAFQKMDAERFGTKRKKAEKGGGTWGETKGGDKLAEVPGLKRNGGKL